MAYPPVRARTGKHCRAEQVAHADAHLVTKHDEDDRRGDDLSERPRGGDHPESEILPVAVPQHDRKRDQAHGRDRGAHDSGSRREQRSHEDDGERKTAPEPAEEETDRLQELLCQLGLLQDGTHENEEGDGEKRVVRHGAERALRHRGHEDEIEVADERGDERERERCPTERERDGIAGEDESERAQEHHGSPECAPQLTGLPGQEAASHRAARAHSDPLGAVRTGTGGRLAPRLCARSLPFALRRPEADQYVDLFHDLADPL